jgi:hypothetical protein
MDGDEVMMMTNGDPNLGELRFQQKASLQHHPQCRFLT